MPVFAAGNDRSNWNELNPSKNQNDLITARSASKNGITVAAVGNVSNYVNASSVSMSSFSNYGPMDDFRIKPDISAKGVNVLSTSSQNNSSYATLSGTSMAAPAISAVLALLQQHYNNKNAVFMRSATAKGLILHTADEAGPAEGPDHMFGWGLVNARAAAQIITNTTVSSLILENTLQQGQSFTRTVYSAGNQPLQASISWTDRPGTANNNVVDLATPSLVNDLDIRITRNNETFLPWRLTSNFNAPVAVRADNNIDPFEKIQIANPSAGTYTITVTHKNNLVGASQNYSLIVSGIDETLSNDSFTDSNAIKVYPNPSTQFLTISNIIDKGVSNINVYDLNGRLIKGVNLVPNSLNDYTLSTQDFNEGMYILKIQFINGEISYHKFLKRN